MDPYELPSQSWNWSNLNNGEGNDDDGDGVSLPFPKRCNRAMTAAPTSPPATSSTAIAGLPSSGVTDRTIIPGRDASTSGDNNQGADEDDEEDEPEEEEEEDEWDKSTAEIQSISSEELHETRPNRWTGHPNTWRHWTKNDRDVWTSLEAVRMGDLGVHLYNAFALGRDAVAATSLKRKKELEGKGKGKEIAHGEEAGLQGEGLPRSAQRELTEDAQEGEDEEVWAPPKSWTSWPKRNYAVLGGGELMPEDAAILRRDWRDGLPSQNLEEEISSGILNATKVRFYRRKIREEAKAKEPIVISSGEESDELMQSVENETTGWRAATRSRSRNRSRATRHATSGNESAATADQPRKRKRSPDYEPIPLAYDEAAYEMLRPAARQILKKLDDTLTVLHNSRIATLRPHEDEPEESDTDNEGGDEGDIDTEGEQTPSPTLSTRGRGRPRNPDLIPHYEKERSESRRGRPRKVHVPREGETEEEMLIRVRKESKRRMPEFYFDSDYSGRSKSDISRSRSVGRSSRTKKTTTKTTADKAGERQSSVSRDSRESSVTDRDPTYYSRRHLKRLPLRDWRDVMGAAALAGFEPDVIARATQRCATLFGGEMTIHTLNEVPLTKSLKEGVETVSYKPKPPPEDLDPESDAEMVMDDNGDKKADLQASDLLMLQNRRATSRPPSMPGCRAVEPPPSSPGSETAGSRSRRRQRSATPGRARGGSHLCPHPDCPEALTGFARAWNLKRHLERIHGQPHVRSKSRSGAPTPGAVTTDDEGTGRSYGGGVVEEFDSMDEMDGAVHVDGFLQVIKVRKGWRSEVGTRPRTYRKRATTQTKGKERETRKGRGRRRGSIGRGYDNDEDDDAREDGERVVYESST